MVPKRQPGVFYRTKFRKVVVVFVSLSVGGVLRSPNADDGGRVGVGSGRTGSGGCCAGTVTNVTLTS